MDLKIRDSIKPMSAYLIAAFAASSFYIIWTTFFFMSRSARETVGFLFHLGFSIFFWLFNGTAAALVLLFPLWYLTVRIYSRVQRFGTVYFGIIGAVITLIIGSGTASLSPKPLFIEDQTFIEGFIISIQRQGICLSLTGLVFGLTYWFLCERHRKNIAENFHA